MSTSDSDYDKLGLGPISPRSVVHCGYNDLCSATGDFHLIITHDAENTTSCAQHLPLAMRGLAPLAVHELGGACCMPGSIYDWERNVCFHPLDDELDAKQAASVSTNKTEVER